MGAPFKIFLLEDDESDAFLISRALATVEPHCLVTHFDTPLRVVELLEGAGTPADELPHLILTDLKMPLMSGIEFVKRLRASRFSTLPVLMLSSSNMAQDILRGYDAGINSWITKPNSYDEMVAMFRITVRFWRDICLVPGFADSALATKPGIIR